jgi:hypothetical protein
MALSHVTVCGSSDVRMLDWTKRALEARNHFECLCRQQAPTYALAAGKERANKCARSPKPGVGAKSPRRPAVLNMIIRMKQKMQDRPAMLAQLCTSAKAIAPKPLPTQP